MHPLCNGANTFPNGAEVAPIIDSAFCFPWLMSCMTVCCEMQKSTMLRFSISMKITGSSSLIEANWRSGAWHRQWGCVYTTISAQQGSPAGSAGVSNSNIAAREVVVWSAHSKTKPHLDVLHQVSCWWSSQSRFRIPIVLCSRRNQW